MMNQEPDFSSLMPDTFVDLGNTSYGAAIDNYQAQFDDFDLKGPNAQLLASNASYDEEGTSGGQGNDCCFQLIKCSEELEELAEQCSIVAEENEQLIDEIAGLEDALTASGGCTSFGYGIYQHNMMNGNVCISTYTNSLGQKRLKMDWMSTGNQVTASPGGATGFVKLFCNVWSDTAKIGQVSWGNNDNILMPYRYSNPMKGPVTLSESRNSNNYPIGGSATHIRLTPITDSTYIAGIIRISDIPEFFSLTYSAGTGGSVEGELSQNVLKAEDGTAVTATSDAGYTFTGWSDGSTENPRTDTNVTSNINVTANFAIT